ncbi:MAG: PaaI family thioesterase [Rhodospirillales bacterium]|nr:PaaI family thioesterase [Rhodospirillales bacterium]
MPETTDMKQLTKMFEAIPHCRELGLTITSLAPGKASLSLGYQDRLAGNPETGVVHGGVISTLLDTIAGLTAMSAVPATTPVATLDLRIDYLKPARPGMTIFAEADCFRLTSSVAFVRAAAHHGDNTDPIAHCMATFMLNSVGFTTDSQATK